MTMTPYTETELLLAQLEDRARDVRRIIADMHPSERRALARHMRMLTAMLDD